MGVKEWYSGIRFNRFLKMAMFAFVVTTSASLLKAAPSNSTMQAFDTAKINMEKVEKGNPSESDKKKFVQSLVVALKKLAKDVEADMDKKDYPGAFAGIQIFERFYGPLLAREYQNERVEVQSSLLIVQSAQADIKAAMSKKKGRDRTRIASRAAPKQRTVEEPSEASGEGVYFSSHRRSGTFKNEVPENSKILPGFYQVKGPHFKMAIRIENNGGQVSHESRGQGYPLSIEEWENATRHLPLDVKDYIKTRLLSRDKRLYKKVFEN